jgi:FAD/FMN-containing dehydrogenase
MTFAMSRTPLDAELIARFASIVGTRHALTDPAEIAPYVQEPRGRWPGRSSLVLRPGSTAEVSAILKLADETCTPIVPQGGNTGLVGGQMPDLTGGEIVLSLARMNGIREFDAESATMTVDAGCILSMIQHKAEEAGFLFPLSLASEGSCQIGGNLSSNAGGVAVLAYGNARDLCLGLEVVLPGGAVLDDLRKLKKDNTGYDLKNLFIGAEGTLGVITGAVLKLHPKPKGRAVAWVGLSSPAAALDLFRRASSAAGPALVSFELIADLALAFALKHGRGLIPPLAGRHRWHVLLEIAALADEQAAAPVAETLLEEAFAAGEIEDAMLARSEAQAVALWRIRETIPETQKAEGASVKHDISVPVASIPGFIAWANAAVEAVSPDARIVCFGHMGDGNLHFNISQPAGADTAAFLAGEEALHAAVHSVVRTYDGSISAEHGIGRMKRDELAATAPPVALDLMRRIKKAFDPNGIMNPGKVL